jgi:hypothetical protein
MPAFGKVPVELRSDRDGRGVRRHMSCARPLPRGPSECYFLAVTRSEILSYSVFGMMCRLTISPGSL